MKHSSFYLMTAGIFFIAVIIAICGGMIYSAAVEKIIVKFEEMPKQVPGDKSASLVPNDGYENNPDVNVDMGESDDYRLIATGTWKTYNNEYWKFSIQYPSNWIVVPFDNERGASKSILFGTQASVQGGYIWGIDVLPGTGPVESTIKQYGNQFKDRQEVRQRIKAGIYNAEMVTITTASIPDWISKLVIIEAGNNTYLISNGAVEDKNFEKFYNSFKIK